MYRCPTCDRPFTYHEHLISHGCIVDSYRPDDDGFAGALAADSAAAAVEAVIDIVSAAFDS